MGYVRHNAIVVSSWSEDKIAKAREVAAEMVPGLVSEVIPYRINGGGSFLIAPDGSKEGWEESDCGDSQRDAFVAWLETQRYEDNSTPFCWAEITLSGDDREAKIVRHAWQVEMIDD